MYQGKHSTAASAAPGYAAHTRHAAPRRSARRSRLTRRRLLGLIAALALVCSLGVGGTLAWLSSGDSLTNSVAPGSVPIEISSSGSGVTITNHGNVHAYIRAVAIQNGLDGSGNIIPAGSEGFAFAMPSPANSAEWTELGGFYYYNAPVAPGGSVSFAVSAAAGTELKVMAQSVQALGGRDGQSASRTLWGVSCSGGVWSA